MRGDQPPTALGLSSSPPTIKKKAHPPTWAPRVRGSFPLDGRVVYTPPFALQPGGWHPAPTCKFFQGPTPNTPRSPTPPTTSVGSPDGESPRCRTASAVSTGLGRHPAPHLPPGFGREIGLGRAGTQPTAEWATPPPPPGRPRVGFDTLFFLAGLAAHPWSSPMRVDATPTEDKLGAGEVAVAKPPAPGAGGAAPGAEALRFFFYWCPMAA